MSGGMRAWTIDRNGDPADVLNAVDDRAIPEPGPGEVRLRVAAAGIGLPDVMMCRGTYAFSPPTPFVPGQEVVGTVDAAGEGCSLAVGDRVLGVTAFYAGNGGFADFCIVPEFSLYPVPEGMGSLEAAAFSIPWHTAWVGLKLRANTAPGEVLLVHGGAGGTGAAAIRLGVALGARVIASAGGEEKQAYCRAAGAEACIDYQREDVVASVLELTDGRGADVIYDPVGGELFERSVSCTASGGRLLAVGYACGRWGAPDSRELVLRNCAALGVFVGAHDREEMLSVHEDICRLYTAGVIYAEPDQVVEFDEISRALVALERRDILGKAVVRVHC